MLSANTLYAHMCRPYFDALLMHTTPSPHMWRYRHKEPHDSGLLGWVRYVAEACLECARVGCTQVSDASFLEAFQATKGDLDDLIHHKVMHAWASDRSSRRVSLAVAPRARAGYTVYIYSCIVVLPAYCVRVGAFWCLSLFLSAHRPHALDCDDRAVDGAGARRPHDAFDRSHSVRVRLDYADGRYALRRSVCGTRLGVHAYAADDVCCACSGVCDQHISEACGP